MKLIDEKSIEVLRVKFGLALLLSSKTQSKQTKLWVLIKIKILFLRFKTIIGFIKKEQATFPAIR
jgi:hypothetical protein